MAAPVKRSRGRPKGAKDKQPRKLRVEASPVTDTLAQMSEELAGNGRDETEVREALQAADDLVRPVPPPASPALAKMFVAAVENGYIIRPAYSDSYKGAGDDRSWVVTSKEQLAAMIVSLVAERSATTPDLRGPQLMLQPDTPHYAPPIGLQADETVG